MCMGSIKINEDDNYIVAKDYDVLFKVWNTLGINWMNSQYIGKKFKTMDDYHVALMVYHGLNEKSLDGLSLNYDIIDTANEYLSNVSNLVCPGGSIKMYHIDFGYDRQLSSPSVMTNWYDGMGSKPFGSFSYVKDPDFICKDIGTDYYQNELYPELSCYDDECIRDNTSEVSNIIYKKYGIRMNFNIDDEKNIKGIPKMGRW